MRLRMDGRLLVAGAVEGLLQILFERAEALFEAGADLV